MLNLIFGFQGILNLVLGLLALGLQVFALVDCVRQRADAFPAAGKQTKTVWLAILGVATAIGVIFVLSPLTSIFDLIAVAAAGVYLVDVRPKVRQVSGGGYGGGPSGRW